MDYHSFFTKKNEELVRALLKFERIKFFIKQLRSKELVLMEYSFLPKYRRHHQ